MKKDYQVAINLLAETIKGTRFENNLYVLGGCIRDDFLGYNPKDIDILVDLGDFEDCSVAEFIAEKLGIGKNLKLEKDKAPTLSLRGLKRQGVSLNHVKVDFIIIRNFYHGKDDQAIIARLYEHIIDYDFTINTLLLNVSTRQLFDLTKLGLSDLRARVLRTPLDPTKTLKDHSRLLRAVYFMTKYKLKCSLLMIRVIRRESYLLRDIPLAQLQLDFNRILMSDRPEYGLKLLKVTKLLSQLFPELRDLSKSDLKIVSHGLDDASLQLEGRLKTLFQNLDSLPKLKTSLVTKLIVNCLDLELPSYDDLEVVSLLMSHLDYTPQQISYVTGKRNVDPKLTFKTL